MATKTRPKKKTRSAADRYSSQVGAEADLKFGPEERSLADELRGAEGERDQAYAGARGVRAAIEGASARAMPQLKADYGTAQRAVDDATTSLATALKDTPLSGAAARDAQGVKARLAESLAAAETETASRARDAASGEAFAKQTAAQRFASTAERIGERGTALAGEKGTFAAARSGELVEGARGRSVTRRGQDKSAETAANALEGANERADRSATETERHNKESEKAARAKKNAGKVATPANVEKARTSVNRAMDAARAVAGELSAEEKKKGVKQRPRSETAKILVNGRAGVTIKNDPDTGEPLANPVKVAGVKQQDQLYASVALDMLYDGRLSQKNQQRLRALGLTPAQLGVRPAYSGVVSRPGTAPAGRKPGGQQRPT